MKNKMFEKAENFASQYIWQNEFSRENFVKTLVIQGETVQAVKERWQNMAGAGEDDDLDSNRMYREQIDTINAHYIAILTDLLNTASPITDTTD